jgi:hypothetical protein
MHEVVGFATFTCLYATHGFGFLFLSATLGGFYGFVLASVIRYLVSRSAVRYFCRCGGVRVLRWYSRFALASAFCLRASSVAPVRGGTYFSLPPQRKVGKRKRLTPPTFLPA